MGYIRHSIVLGAALVFGHVAVADAKGLGGSKMPAGTYKSAVPAPAPTYKPAVAVRKDWYLRGDVGVTWFNDPDGFEANIDMTKEEIDSAWSIGGGIGHYFSRHLRGDLTFDYLDNAEVSGVDPTMQNALHKVDLKSYLFLANIYYDFGPREHFTPYVGFGLGVVHHETEGRGITINGAPFSSSQGDEKTNVAAAAMVGFSYGMKNNWLLDAGYRFLFLGDAETKETVTGAWAPMQIDNIHAHQFRVGLRYDFGHGPKHMPFK